VTFFKRNVFHRVTGALTVNPVVVKMARVEGGRGGRLGERVMVMELALARRCREGRKRRRMRA
jgi:hypothetical protein